MLYVATVASLIYLYMGQLAFFYGLTCNYESIFNDNLKAFYDPDDSSIRGICFEYVTDYRKFFVTPNGRIAASVLFSDFQLLVPVFVFLFLDKPHDCFVCCGKDPDRVYSSLQLTRKQRSERRMFIKFSMRGEEAEKHFDNKIKE